MLTAEPSTDNVQNKSSLLCRHKWLQTGAQWLFHARTRHSWLLCCWDTCSERRLKIVSTLRNQSNRFDGREPEACSATFHKYFSASYGTATPYSCVDWWAWVCWPPLIQNNDLECLRFSSCGGGTGLSWSRGRREKENEKFSKDFIRMYDGLVVVYIIRFLVNLFLSLAFSYSLATNNMMDHLMEKP